MKQCNNWRSQLLTGLLLIAAGVLLVLDRMDLFYITDYWRFWPFLIVAFGIVRLAGVTRAEDVSGGLWLVFVGLWLYACMEHVWGITFRNSWPFLLIAAGTGLVLKPFIARSLAAKERNHEQH